MPVNLPLWAATASLPLCLKPNTKSIHSWRCSDTYWLSRAALCFWRKSLVSGVMTNKQETVDSNSSITKQHSNNRMMSCCQLGVGVGVREVQRAPGSNRVYMHAVITWLTGSYLRPTLGERRHRLSSHFAFCPNQGSVCFPESWGRSHKTLESAALWERHPVHTRQDNVSWNIFSSRHHVKIPGRCILHCLTYLPISKTAATLRGQTLGHQQLVNWTQYLFSQLCPHITIKRRRMRIGIAMTCTNSLMNRTLI